MEWMGPPLVYQVNLTELQGEGDSPCPGCGVIISPEDETEDVYRIVNTKVNGDELEELVIQCNRCKSKIRLVGFTVPEM
jgi:DNA-directed RNA polymerase subunit RPC12/RpoP